MPRDDAWDWKVLLYLGTVILRRSEVAFWRMTPRKLNALCAAHIAMNPTGGDDSGKKQKFKPGYIDQVI